jgi:hypothetical protein
MKDTKRMRITQLENTLCNLGFSLAEVPTLLSVERGLRRWHGLECGSGDSLISVSVERDEAGKPFRRVQYATHAGWVDQRTPCRDMEKANLRRLSRLMEGKPVRAYVQGDPRGCALYILRPGDVPEGGDVNAYYYRGIPVCI